MAKNELTTEIERIFAGYEQDPSTRAREPRSEAEFTAATMAWCRFERGWDVSWHRDGEGNIVGINGIGYVP